MPDLTDTTLTGEEPEARSGPIRDAIRETRDSLASVFRNRNLRRVQLALGGSMIGDWAYATAVAVWAYGVGGAQAVGIWSAIRLGLMAVVSPVGAAVADRYPRKTVMVVSDLVRAVLVVAAAACLFLDLPAATVFVLATVTALCGSAFRPAQRAIMPSLANRPEELTASNGTSSTLESLSFFAGPALGALLIGLTEVPVVFLVNAATFVWSTVLVLGITPRVEPVASGRDVGATADPPKAGPDSDAVDDRAGAGAGAGTGAGDGAAPAPPKPGFVAETLAGFRTIWRDKDLLVVTAEVSAQTVVAGATAVFFVVMAVDVLGTGAKGVGYLDSVFGIGAILGGFFAISRASRGRLAFDMTMGVVLWALPLLLVTAWPTPVGAFAAVVVLGFGNPLVDVNMDTIIQRITPDHVMGRVFGALETCLIGTMALGAAAMPFLIHWLGLRGALAALGTAITLLALAGLPRMRSLDQRLSRPAGLSLLEAIPMFAPLARAVVESLAFSLVKVPVRAGDVVLREGEPSDRFYVIESGQVEVTQDGRVLRREGAGDFFGEIGLLRDVPRTATITALEDTVLLALEREDFLSAVTGEREARSAADDIVTRRLTV